MIDLEDMVAEPRWAGSDTLDCCGHNAEWTIGENGPELSPACLLYIPGPDNRETAMKIPHW